MASTDTRAHIDTFNEFMRRSDHTPNERLLLQTIATLTTVEGNRNKTPDEVWEDERQKAYFLMGSDE